MASGIYRILNKLNGRIYIGSTKNFTSRKNQHLSELRRNKHENNFFQNDWNKCGEENFLFELVELVEDHERLLVVEQSYIDNFFDNKKTCYNINRIANKPPSNLNKSMSEIAKQKIRLSKIGEKNPNWMKQTPEHVKNKLIKNSRPKTKIYSLNVKTGDVLYFDGIGIASRFHNIHRNSISDRIRGRSFKPIQHLHFFRYADESCSTYT